MGPRRAEKSKKKIFLQNIMKWDHGEQKKTIGAKVSVYVVNRSASKSVSQGILPLPPPPPPMLSWQFLHAPLPHAI